MYGGVSFRIKPLRQVAKLQDHPRKNGKRHASVRLPILLPYCFCFFVSLYIPTQGYPQTIRTHLPNSMLNISGKRCSGLFYWLRNFRHTRHLDVLFLGGTPPKQEKQQTTSEVFYPTPTYPTIRIPPFVFSFSLPRDARSCASHARPPPAALRRSAARIAAAPPGGLKQTQNLH